MHSTNVRKMRQEKIPKNQSGITLVVVMVILVVMTFLGLGAMQDSNLQVSMVRNVQLQNHLHNLSLAEINAQIDEINGNAPGAFDQLIFVVANRPPGARTVDVVTEFPELLELDTILGNTVDAADSDRIEQELTLTQPNEFNAVLFPGFSVDGPIVPRLMQFESEVSISGTALNSNQTQGIAYLAPRPQSN